MRSPIVAAALLAVAGCSVQQAKQAPETPKAEPANILHISRGGIAYPDGDEVKRHWSNYTINLIDGSQAYGWTSEDKAALPHDLFFELAGNGRITGFALDSTFAPVRREDGRASNSPSGSPVRHFALWGSTVSRNGPWTKLYQGEAKADQRTAFTLDRPAEARWLKLTVNDSWAGGAPVRLSEFEVMGELAAKDGGAVPDVTGYYMHEYGPIVLRQDGHLIHGCYNNGDGQLEGMILGRVMRLAWYMPKEKSIGMATLVADGNQLYGFWYRDQDRMGSPWNAVKVPDSDKSDRGPCGSLLPR